MRNNGLGEGWAHCSGALGQAVCALSKTKRLDCGFDSYLTCIFSTKTKEASSQKSVMGVPVIEGGRSYESPALATRDSVTTV